MHFNSGIIVPLIIQPLRYHFSVYTKDLNLIWDEDEKKRTIEIGEAYDFNRVALQMIPRITVSRGGFGVSKVGVSDNLAQSQAFSATGGRKNSINMVFYQGAASITIEARNKGTCELVTDLVTHFTVWTRPILCDSQGWKEFGLPLNVSDIQTVQDEDPGIPKFQVNIQVPWIKEEHWRVKTDAVVLKEIILNVNPGIFTLLKADGSVQNNRTTDGAMSMIPQLFASSPVQTQTSLSVQLSGVTKQLAAANSIQSQTSLVDSIPSIAVILSATNSVQDSISSVAAITQTEILLADNSTQDSSSSTGAATQIRILIGANSSQSASSSTGIVTPVVSLYRSTLLDFEVNPSDPANSCTAGGLPLNTWVPPPTPYKGFTFVPSVSTTTTVYYSGEFASYGSGSFSVAGGNQGYLINLGYVTIYPPAGVAYNTVSLYTSNGGCTITLLGANGSVSAAGPTTTDSLPNQITITSPIVLNGMGDIISVTIQVSSVLLVDEILFEYITPP